MDKTTVRLKLDDTEIKDVSKNYEDDEFPTLRDFCILLYQACAHGVSWSLANSLSKKLGISYDDIAFALDEIVRENIHLSHAEAVEKFWNREKPSDLYFDKSFKSPDRRRYESIFPNNT